MICWTLILPEANNLTYVKDTLDGNLIIITFPAICGLNRDLPVVCGGGNQSSWQKSPSTVV